MSVLGLDIGTSGCKAVIINENGKILARAYKEYNSIVPRSGWLELDAKIFWDSVQSTICEVAGQIKADQISVVSLATMGDSFVAVDKSGEPVCNFILASDGRSTSETDFLANEIGYKKIYLSGAK